MRFPGVVLTLISTLGLVGCSAGAGVHQSDGSAGHQPGADWDYEENGPAVWAQLAPDYLICAEGSRQSPIDLAGAELTDVVSSTCEYAVASLRVIHHEHVEDDVINNGHTIQVNVDGGGTIRLEGDVFQLVQFHFHSPSEHTVEGQHFPMEAHLVHADESRNLAVLGLFIKEGRHNPIVEPIWSQLPQEKGREIHLEYELDAEHVLPENPLAYRYDGSLTTPPCMEGVRWLVMAEPVELSRAQIETFRALFHGNNRPVQARNRRPLMIEEVR